MHNSDCITRRVNAAGWDCAASVHETLGVETVTRQMMAPYAQRYLAPSSIVEGEIKEFMAEHFGKHTLGVHIRGTDRTQDKKWVQLLHGIGSTAPGKVPSSLIIASIENYLAANPECDRIFVASDNVPQLQDIQRRFGDMVVSVRAHRSADNAHAVHRLKKGDIGKKKLVEVLVDMWLLSKTKYLLKCVSEVSMASLVVNPDLGFDLLNLNYKPTGYRNGILGFKGNTYVPTKWSLKG